MFRATVSKAAFLGAVMIAAVAGASQAMAQDEQAVPCSVEEFRQMDFWVGHWDVRWIDPEGVEQHGTNTISHQLDTCMIFEEFDGHPGNALLGRSMSMYVARLGVWKQVWMDNSGGYFALTGGPEGDTFVLTMDRLSEEAPYLRMVFKNISETSFDWHWQSSANEGASWDDRWHIMYSRTE